MTKPTQDKETLREAVIGKIRTHFSNDIQAAIVADAAIAAMFERLRTPSEGVLEASKPFRKGVGETAGRIWQAMLDAFEHGNDHEWEYTGTDPHGSHKGERAYRCKKCKAFDYRPDGE